MLARFLRDLAEVLNAQSGLFRVIDERAPAVRTNIHYNLDPDLQAAHCDYFISHDAYVDALRDRSGGTMAPGEALVDQDALKKKSSSPTTCNRRTRTTSVGVSRSETTIARS